MITKIFTVYDGPAGAYLAPLFFQSAGQCVRAFTDSANDQENLIGKHPADYTLFEVGTYDDASGIFENIMHINLGTAIEMINRPDIKSNGAPHNPMLIDPSDQR